LYNDLKKKYGTDKLTVAAGSQIKIDFVNSVIEFESKKYSIDPVGEAAQELIVDGGLEEWVKKNL
jgi:homoaconitate hydratase